MAVDKLPYDFFPVTYWVSPPAEDARYAELAECGFTLAFACDVDLAHKHGMRSLVVASGLGGSETGGSLTEASKCADASIDAMVDRYASKPGFFGFILSDEPTSVDFPQLAYQNQRILARNPKLIPFMNLNPTYAPLYWLGTKTYEEYVEKFVTTVKPKVISFDHYALFTDGMRPEYYENLQIIRRVSLRHSIPFWYVLLSTPLWPDKIPGPGEPRLAGPYRDPSEGDLRWQVYTSLAYGAQGLVYFTYYPPDPQPGIHFGDAIIKHDGTRDPKYWIVKQINSEVNALGQTLLRLTSTNVYHIAHGEPLPPGTISPPKAALIPSTTAGNLVVGEFTGPKGTQYILLANASCSVPFDGDIVFSSAVKKLAEVPKTPGRKLKWQSLPKDKILHTQHLAPGDGRLFEVK
jgi:hypothetical protein